MITGFPVRGLLRLTLALLTLPLVHAAQPAPAQPQDLSGPWRGSLQVDPSTTVIVELTFTRQPGGTYLAVLDSLDSDSIRNVPAERVSWHDGTLDVQVQSLSGRYQGVLQGGRIEGCWSQPGSVLPLVLSPYVKPRLSKAGRDRLLGAWNGQVPGLGAFVARFSVDEGGEPHGVAAIQAEGGRQHPLTRLNVDARKLTFTVADMSVEYHGAYVNGAFIGMLSRPGLGKVPVALRKGELAGASYALKLPADVFAGLLGNWHGILQITSGGQALSLPLVMRWVVNAQAQMVAVIDSPKAAGIPVTEASFVGSRLTLKVGSLNAQYEATRSGTTLVGRWTQAGTSSPLTFKKD
jgi:hypothetical protein